MPVPVCLLVLRKSFKWPTENGLVGQGIAIESEGSLFKCHLVLCQA